MPNHTFQNILKWGSEDDSDLRTSDRNIESFKTNVIEAASLQEW
jgi:hypothetical protein